MPASAVARTFFIPNQMTMIIFIPFALLAAGFFSFPSSFVGILLPIGGLWYYILSTLLSGFQPSLGYSFVAFGEGFMTILAITGVSYLYVLACYISYIVRRKNNDLKRLTMASSLVAIFISPFAIGYGQAFFTRAPEIPRITISYLDERSCEGLGVANGSSFWNATDHTCLVVGTLKTSKDSILGIRERVTLIISGPASRFENEAGNTVMNNGTIMLISGAVLVNDRISTDSNDSQGVILNRGSITIQNSSMLLNKGRIDNIFNTGKVSNRGTLDNSGELVDSNTLENDGKLINAGLISNNYYYTNTKIWNYGSIINEYEFENFGSTIENFGSIENYGNMYSTFIHNHSFLDSSIGKLNSERISVYCGSKTIVTNENIDIVDFCKLS